MLAVVLPPPPGWNGKKIQTFFILTIVGNSCMTPFSRHMCITCFQKKKGWDWVDVRNYSCIIVIKHKDEEMKSNFQPKYITTIPPIRRQCNNRGRKIDIRWISVVESWINRYEMFLILVIKNQHIFIRGVPGEKGMSFESSVVLSGSQNFNSVKNMKQHYYSSNNREH